MHSEQVAELDAAASALQALVAQHGALQARHAELQAQQSAREAQPDAEAQHAQLLQVSFDNGALRDQVAAMKERLMGAEAQRQQPLQVSADNGALRDQLTEGYPTPQARHSELEPEGKIPVGMVRAYLPEFAGGKRLVVQVQDGFLVDNSELQAMGPGLGFRRSRNFYDRYNDQIYGQQYAPWDSVLTGVLAAGWLEVYLPNVKVAFPVAKGSRVQAEDVDFEAVLHDGIDGRPPGDG